MKTHILIHCSATPEGREVSSATIDAWHKARCFEPYIRPDGRRVYCGYHLLVHLDGSYERMRPDNARGQHCTQANMNNAAIAICYIGGLAKDGKTPKDTRTEAQKKTLLTLVRTLRGRYGNLIVKGHRDFAPKACPCFDASTLLT